MTLPHGFALQAAQFGIVELHPDDLSTSTVWDKDGRLHVHWMSPFSCGDGYATAAEQVVAGLIQHPRLRITVRHCWFVVDRGVRQDVLQALREEVPGEPCQVGICLATAGQYKLLPTPYKVGWTMYESTDPLELHPQWKRECNEVDELWVPTPYIREHFFKPFVSVPIHVMPLALNEMYYEGRLRRREPREDYFHVGIWGGLSGRKSPLEVIEYFLKVFPLSEYPDCRLTLKTRCGLLGKGTYNLPKLTDPRIRIIDDTWLPERMVKLAEDLDVFVFPSKGEGYGLPSREAMIAGVPTILTSTSGHLEVTNDMYNWPVPVVGKEATELGGEWDVPDWDYYADLLRWHYHNRETARKKAILCAEWLWKRRCPSAIAQLIADHLEGIDPFVEAPRRVKTWGEVYAKPVSDAELRHLLKHHEAFFTAISERLPPGARILEVGAGSGATSLGLSLMNPNLTVLDINPAVIATAREALEGNEAALHIEWLVGDAFKLEGLDSRYTAVVSQGFFEHFPNSEIHQLLRQQLSVADKVMFSVPSVYYPAQDVGDERLLSIGEWKQLLSDYVVTKLKYYGGDSGKYHVFACIEGFDKGVRGSMVKRRL